MLAYGNWEKSGRMLINRRAGWLCLILSAALLLLSFRLFQIQLINGPRWAQRAVAQRTDALPLDLGRGSIFDRNLRALHAPSISWNLIAYRPFLPDSQEVAHFIGSRLGLSAKEIQQRLENSPDNFVILASELPVALAGEVSRWNIPGIAFVPYEERYGSGAVAQHIVGYINRADNRGVAGLELTFNDEIKGSGDKTLLVMFDAKHNPLSSSYRVRSAGAGQTGNDLVTTIDWRLQAKVEEILGTSRRPGAAIVVDARTGDILAAASSPTFEQHRIADYLDGQRGDPLVNRAVKAFPPGSVFKTVVAAAALEAGILPAYGLVECTGALEIGDRVFYSQCPPGDDENRVAWQDAMALSSNEVFIRLGLELGAERLLAATERFGFGQTTGLPLPEEVAGFLPDPGDILYAGNLANLAIGQGQLAVTPMQVAQFFTAIVNDGELQPLRLVREIRRSDGVLLKAFAPAPRRRVMTTDTAAMLRQALRLTVTHGTGRLAELPGWGAGGKTGTAETGRRLADGRELAHAWFAGYVPATLPRYVIVVFVEDGMSGPEVAAPRFREIARALTSLHGR